MKKKKPKPKPRKPGMKPWLKATLWAGAILILASIIAPFVQKYFDDRKKAPMTRGMIMEVWMEPARHDVRMRSPGYRFGPGANDTVPPVYEEAWLDTTYWMTVKDPATPRRQTIQLYNREVYEKYKKPEHLYELVRLETDSAKVAENQAEWEADSIKYAKTIREMREKAAKKMQQQ